MRGQAMAPPCRSVGVESADGGVVDGDGEPQWDVDHVVLVPGAGLRVVPLHARARLGRVQM